jgi:hypothetical protein
MESYRRRLESWGVLCLWGAGISQSWPAWLAKQVPRIDLILYNRPHITARFLPTLTRLYPDAYRVYNTHDLHGLREQLEARQGESPPLLLSPPEEPAASLETICTAQERLILQQVHAVISISPKETTLLRRHLGGSVHTVPGYISRWRGEGAGREEAGQSVLFVGGFGHKPNRVGLRWFLEQVWPLLAAEVRVIVVGSNCPPELELLLRGTAHLLTDEEILFRGPDATAGALSRPAPRVVG